MVGLGFNEEEEFVSGRRRKCREMIGEGSYKEPGMRFATYRSSSDSDNSDDDVEKKQKEKRVKKEKPVKLSA